MSIRFRQVDVPVHSSCGPARLPTHHRGVPRALPRRGVLPRVPGRIPLASRATAALPAMGAAPGSLERRHLWECSDATTKPRLPRGPSCTALTPRFASGSGRPTVVATPRISAKHCSDNSGSPRYETTRLARSCRSFAGRWSHRSASRCVGEGRRSTRASSVAVNPDRKGDAETPLESGLSVSPLRSAAPARGSARRLATLAECKQAQPRVRPCPVEAAQRRARRDRPHRRLSAS